MNDSVHPEEAIFEAAFALPASERAAYLDRTCGGNAGLRQLVEALLEAHEEAGEFLEDPAPGAEPSPAAGTQTPRAGSETVSVSIEKPGDRIGRYKLLQQIGEGGCGVVYMAEQEEPVRRKVALKVIKLGMDTKQVIARFEAERQAVALMDHPNIAKVFDAGATDTGRPFFVMELVKGIPITHYCDENCLSTEQRLRLFVQLCQAIQHAHQKGIIHRDIKPSNILVADHDGVPVPKIIDFGIAKATTDQRLTDKTLFTAFEQFMGTPAYMSPEQAKLSGLDIDTRSDIYSLGVLLYELLTGSTPFDSKALMQAGLDEIRRTIREQEPARPSTRLSTMAAADLTEVAKQRHTEPAKLGSLIRGDLDWIVMKALEKERARRYETANGLATDILRHLNCEPVVARPPSRLYEFQKTVRRHKLGFAAAAALIAMLAVGTLVSTLEAIRAARAERSAIVGREREAQLRQHAEEERARATQAELRARQNLYAADMNLASQAVQAGNIGRARSLLQAHRPGPGQEDLRGFEWRYLWAEARGDNFAVLRGHSNVVTSVAVSPDGKTLISGSQDSTVRLWDLASRRLIATLPSFGGLVHSVAFSPDGKVFAVGSSTNGATLWSSESHKRVAALGGHNSRVCFSPAGELLAFGTSESYSDEDGQSVTLFNYVTGETVATFPEGGSRAAFSTDGRLLAMAGKGAGVKLWDIATRREVCILSGEGYVKAVAFSPDKHALVVSYWSGTVHVWDLLRQQILTSLTGHRAPVWDLAFSPDGQTLATASSDQTVRLWDVSTWQSKSVVRGHGNEVWGVAFTPDGNTVVSGSKDETIMLSPAHPSRPAETIRDVHWPAQISPDGSLVAAVSTNGQVGLWDLTSGELKVQFPGQGKPVGFLDAGKTLVILSEGASLIRWNLASNTIQSQVSLLHEAPVEWALLSPDGQTVATGIPWDYAGSPGSLRVRLFEARTGLPRAVLEGHTRGSDTLLFSRDNRLLVTVRNSSIQLRDGGSLIERTNMRKHKMLISTCALSPDGGVLATGSYDGNIILWNTDTGADLATLTGHLEGIACVAFSADGKTLASCGDNRVLKLWNMATHRDVATLTCETIAHKLLFSADGRLLLFNDQKARFHLLRAPSFAEIEAAEEELAGLEGPRTSFTNDNPAVAETLSSLVAGLRAQGKQAYAEPLFHEAVALYEKAIANFPNNESLRSHLVDLLRGQGKLADAEPVLQEALALQRKRVGSEHLDVATSLSSLSFLFREEGKLREAEATAREALAIRRKLLGNAHPDTVNSFNLLADLLRAQGKLAEAEAVLREELAIRRKLLGNEHQEVAAALGSLAQVLQQEGKQAEAKSMYREIAERGSAPELNELAWSLATSPDANLRDGTNAVIFAEKAVAATNRKNASYLDTLAAAYAETGQFAKALSIQREAIALSQSEQEKKDLASKLMFYENNSPYRDHGALAELARDRLNEAKFTEAEGPARGCLALREREIPDDWRTFNARSMLGGCLLGQKKYAEAEPLLSSGYDGLKQREAMIPPEGKPRLKEALERLVQLCEQTSRPDQAAEWKKKLAHFDAPEGASTIARPQP
jgi:eukaryotic-like serine/threonine-protein kinase